MVWNALKKSQYKFMSMQFVPSEEDIAEARELAEKLKGETDAETLNNILEWQEENIAYWWERFLFDMPLKASILVGGAVLLTLFIPILIILYVLSGTAFLITIAIVIVFYMFFMFSQTLGKIYYLFVGVPFAYCSILLIFNIELFHSLLPYTYFYVSCLFIFLFAIFYLYFRYLNVDKQSFFEIFNDTFKSGLPVRKIVKYRLAVCRDYAKLTAALLANLYPSNRIYFFTFFEHVAAGIRIGDKVYVLDQKLPILEQEAWLIKWSRREADVLEMLRGNGKTSVRLAGKIVRKRDIKTAGDLRRMFKKLVEEVDKAMREGKNSITLTLGNTTSLFDINDDIIKNSLLRKVELILRREFVGKASKIKSIDVTKEGNDLLLKINLTNQRI